MVAASGVLVIVATEAEAEVVDDGDGYVVKLVPFSFNEVLDEFDEFVGDKLFRFAKS